MTSALLIEDKNHLRELYHFFLFVKNSGSNYFLFFLYPIKMKHHLQNRWPAPLIFLLLIKSYIFYNTGFIGNEFSLIKIGMRGTSR